MYRLRLGSSIKFSDTDFYEKLAEAKTLGFDAVDFDIAGFCDEREKEIENYKHLAEGLAAVKSSGLFLNGVHLSFGVDWNFANPDDGIRLAAVARAKEVFDAVDPFSPFCYIFHGSLEPIPDGQRGLFLGALKKSLKDLRPLTKTRLCIENLPRTCLLNTAKEACEVVDGAQGIDICADVNHFLQEKTEDALLVMGARVKTLHISDCDYVNERHWMPLKGKIDWMKVIGALEKIGYGGVFNYETVGASLREIKENYEKLFAMYNAAQN